MYKNGEAISMLMEAEDVIVNIIRSVVEYNEAKMIEDGEDAEMAHKVATMVAVKMVENVCHKMAIYEGELLRGDAKQEFEELMGRRLS